MWLTMKGIIYLMTASVSLLSVVGNKEKPVKDNCVNAEVNTTAHLGGSVSISCTYPPTDHSTIKQFYREDENLIFRHVISAYTSNYTKQNRYSLTENKEQGIYTVSISSLTQDDAGRYRCTVDSDDNLTSTVCLTEVYLHILHWDDIEPTKKQHKTGENAQIMCPYPKSAVNNPVCLCKGDNPTNCDNLVHVERDDKYNTNHRFHIRKNERKNYFYVDIKNLTTNDSGMYWCVSDGYTKTLLSVTKTPKTSVRSRKSATLTTREKQQDLADDDDHDNDDDEDQEAHPPSPAHVGGIVGGVVVSLTLLVTAAVVLILYRCKLCTKQGGSPEQNAVVGQNTQENQEHHHYEEIEQQREEASSLSTIYALTKPPVDQLHYASIKIQQHSVPEHVHPDTDCDYSSVNIAQDPPTLYSTVTATETAM